MPLVEFMLLIRLLKQTEKCFNSIAEPQCLHFSGKSTYTCLICILISVIITLYYVAPVRFVFVCSNILNSVLTAVVHIIKVGGV